MLDDSFRGENSGHDCQTRYVDLDPADRRLHPLALWSFVLALLGIPLVGLITGTIAVLLAGAALGQITGNPFFRGRRLAVAGLLIGLADIVLWVVLLGFIVPKSYSVAYRSVDQFSFPAPNLLGRAPAHIRKALEANVFIVVERKGWPAFINSESFSGSGVILGENDGQFLILTNRHVVDPAFSRNEPAREDPRNFITAYFHDGSSRTAYIWWTAPDGLDLALVATGPNPAAIPVPEYERTTEVEIGDKVFTVGNPHELSWTYTEGAVSGIREASKGRFHLRIIQTQTPINQGNSGGGLYSADGTLIGIVSWTKDKAQAEGISFAIMYEDFLAVYNKDISNEQ
ncbi:MAG: trypsin-like peptidase domain-containing protein [Desulfomonile tiedjei]|uniref:Trypsin-like peptidase domain-containing protein n=1 Tax=Desulfomonile tiedjei TaxID=2358 RepID=A0A9D6V1D3_9BACT|nr:trypsin-like peptidase domain-containing protein [Desulfomonile tiedjei]